MLKTRPVLSAFAKKLNCRIRANIYRNEATSSTERQAVLEQGSLDEEVSDVFSETNINFGNMTALEMVRAMVVLRICALPGFADNATRVNEMNSLFLHYLTVITEST